jgi:hypothetical protein
VIRPPITPRASGAKIRAGVDFEREREHAEDHRARRHRLDPHVGGDFMLTFGVSAPTRQQEQCFPWIELRFWPTR